MLALKSYSNILVIQRRLNTGCIPAGIEWILRYLKIPNINFDGFQERHDLGNNSFNSVAKHVMSEIAGIKLIDKQFSSGKEKIEYIRQLLKNYRPCLISIVPPVGNCHIVPVVEINDTCIAVLWMDKATVEGQKRKLSLSYIEERHNNSKYGRDILFVEILNS